MNIEQSVQVLRELVSVSILVSSPILAVSVSVGIAVSLIQAVTSVQEASLTFIPKLVSLGIVMVVSAPWILRTLMTFTIKYLTQLTETVR